VRLGGGGRIRAKGSASKSADLPLDKGKDWEEVLEPGHIAERFHAPSERSESPITTIHRFTRWLVVQGPPSHENIG